MDKNKNKEIVWEEVVNRYKAKEIKIEVNWSIAMKTKADSLGELGGIIYSSLAFRLMLFVIGVYFIFNTWYIGLFLILYGIFSGNSIYEDAVAHIIKRAIQDEKYFKLMIKKEVIKIENKSTIPYDTKDKATDKPLAFIHISEEYRDFFTSAESRRPTFYWFTDRYFDHWVRKYARRPYLYIFIKNPITDNIKLRARRNESEEKGFNDLFNSFVEFRDSLGRQEPAILYSFSYVKPNLVAKYDEKEKDFFVVEPKQFEGLKLELFDTDGNAKNFLDTRLVDILDNLNEVYPFANPEKVGEKYQYTDWQPMITETNGEWL